MVTVAQGTVAQGMEASPPWFLKLSRPSRSPSNEVLHHLSRLAGSVSSLAIPQEFGRADAWFYQIGEYFPQGSLDQQWLRPGGFSESARLALLRQLLSALTSLHTPVGGAYVIHGDVKPSNIFVRRSPDGDWQYLLADFDAAVWVGPDQRLDRSWRYTPRYSAPEVLGGGILSTAADYWSLGMLLLECLLGRHPLAELEVPDVRTVLSTGWQPSYPQIEDSYWRALFGGLLERRPEARWQEREIRQWLRRDPAAISAGLILAGESACATPFYIDGIPAYSSVGLAQTLLRQWSVATLHHPDELLAWLRQELRRDDLAALLGTLQTDSTLGEELRLLHFCHALWPSIPALWRGRELSAPNLDAAAHGGLTGAGSDPGWLQSLQDGRAFDFYSKRGYATIEQLANTLRDTQSAYAEAWVALIGQGAPEAARPDAETSLLLTVRLAFSEEFRNQIRRQAERLLDPAMLLQRAAWYLHFGTDLATLSIPQLAILQHLDTVSLLGEQNLASLDEMGNYSPSRLREQIMVLNSQRRLWRNLVVSPGAGITVLRPGDRHRSANPVNLRDFLSRQAERLAANLRNGMAGAARRMLRRRGEPGNSPADIGELWLEMRLVRVTTHQPGWSLRDEYYLARISWRGPADWRIRLRLSHPGWFLPQPRLVTPALPAEGQLLVVLTTDTHVQLVGRRHWFLPLRRTPPMEIRFGPKHPLIPVQGTLRVPYPDCRQPEPLPRHREASLPCPQTLVMEPREASWQTETLRPAAGEAALLREDSLRPGLTPRRWQQRIWMALLRESPSITNSRPGE